MLRKATRRVSALYDDALAPLGINIAQFSLLRNVGRMAPVSLTDLGARVELDRSTVGRNAKVLEKSGLLTISQGKDQREAMLALTDAGRTILAEGAQNWDRAQDEIEARLGPGNIDTLRSLLAAL